MKRNGIAAFAAAWLALASAAGAQAATPCLAPQEADALFTALAPEAIRSVARTCAPVLPAPGLLGGRSEAMAEKFEARAASTLPLAEKAIAKITGNELPDPTLLQPLIKTLAGPMIASNVKPESCGQIDLALGLVEPLPAENLTGLLVLLMQLSGNKEMPQDFNICRATKVAAGH